MNENHRDVVVVGGGISGLTAAWRLKQAGVDVCLLEAQRVVGGCTRTERREGFLLEQGPFNVIVRDPTFEDLLAEFSGEINVITASKDARARFIYRRGRLHKVPTGPVALATTGLLSFGARVRLLAGLLYSRRVAEFEETIEQAAARRFGQEVADTLVSAVIAGIFAGDIRKLSLKGCFPAVHEIDAQVGSLIGFGFKKAFGGMFGGTKRRRRRWRGLVSIDEGLGGLTSAIGRRLGADLLDGCAVDCVEPLGAGGATIGYEINYRDANGEGRTLHCKRLVLAAPLKTASRLIKPFEPGAARILDSLETNSLVVLNLGFRTEDIGHPLRGFGFLAPQNEPEFPLLGVLWADSIFPHHAPPGHRLLRVFIGGSRDPEAPSRSDDELLRTSLDGARDLLDLRGEPMFVNICRYQDAIPQNQLGHTDRIARLREAVGKRPGLTLIGNYLEGVSLNDCIRVATEAARRLIAETPASRRAYRHDEVRMQSEPAMANG